VCPNLGQSASPTRLSSLLLERHHAAKVFPLAVWSPSSNQPPTLAKHAFRIPFCVNHDARQRDGPKKLLKFLILPLAFLCWFPLFAQDARSLVQTTVNAEIAADKSDQSRWIFYEVDKKPKNTVEQWVAQTSRGSVKRVLKKNGYPIAKPLQRQAVEALIRDTDAQHQQQENDKKDDKEAEALLRMLPDAFLWSVKEKNDITTTFHFRPNPDFDPPSHQASVFAAMEGDLTVNNQQHRIEKLKGTMVRDVSFGWGILGSLKKGGWFEVAREQIAPGLWQINETHVHIQGRALLFKSISEQEDDTKSRFTRLPDNVTLQQAAEAVMKQPNAPE